VATPIEWKELRGLSGGAAFNRLNIHRRLDSLALDPWDELASSCLEISPKMRRDVGMKA
jgi:DNA primase